MTTIFSHRKMLHCRAVSAAGNAPILRHAGNGATSQFHTSSAGSDVASSPSPAASMLRRKRLAAGKTSAPRLIDLLPARRLLYKSPRASEVELR
jgi:hypothetical protein